MTEPISQFWKMHALGNDFVVLGKATAEQLGLFTDRRRRQYLCDRRHGIGCDQIIIIAIRAQDATRANNPPESRHPTADTPHADIWYYNADGSAAEACGNGSRCAVAWLTQRTQQPRWVLHIAQEQYQAVTLDAHTAQVEMGQAQFDAHALALADDPQIVAVFAEHRLTLPTRVYRVSVGNPHCVLVFPEGTALAHLPLAALGPAIEHSPLFPDRTNVGFMIETQLPTPATQAVDARVWERGAGETPACGSGACAIATTAVQLGLRLFPVTVRLPGGELCVDHHADSLHLTGAATSVYRGQLVLDDAG